MSHQGGELKDRARHLLKVLVEEYIRAGHPVSSKRLAEVSGLNVSPATIRNIMAELEAQGYIRAPHTSAGRVPTLKGYRLFVHRLVTVQPLQESLVARLREELIGAEPQELLDRAGQLLSQITHLTGLVTLPRREHLALRHVEFLPLSDSRVLAILVLNEQEVQNRIFQTRRAYTADELQRAANFINARFAGVPLEQLRVRLLEELERSRAELGALIDDLARVSQRLFTPVESEGLRVSGQANLLEFRDLTEDIDRLKRLFASLNEQHEMLEVLDRCLDAEGVQVFVGAEAGCEALADVSLITSSYRVDDEVVGVLGVIGPTRIPYDEVIPVVDITARLVSAALEFKKPTP